MFHLSTVESQTYSLLKEVFKVPFINQNFGLAGGTSLALQIGHRKSIDLDFFSDQIFNPTDLENLLAGYTKWKYEPLSRSERMLFCNINSIKCDFVNEPFQLINPFIFEDGIKLYSVPDIAAMKLHTICGRGKKKDFFDVYSLLHKNNWKELVEWFNIKYGPSQLFFLMKSISYFVDADEDVEIRGLPPFTHSWAEIKRTIIEKCH